MSLNVLHLSDLHIDNLEDPNLSLVREGLITDLEEIIRKEQIKIDVIAITGDIINKGNERAYDIGINVINDIMAKCNLEKDRVLIVPGNHDIPRNPIIERMLTNCGDETKSLNFKQKSWPYFSARFMHYKAFMQNLLGEMYNEDMGEGFGVKDIQIEGIKTRFVLLNTAWTTIGNEDYSNILIGRWQLEYIREKISQLGQCDICIVMTHHPLEWLEYEEREMVYDYLRDKKKIGANIILHGHIHNAELSVKSHPGSSLVELVSGIGYPEIKNRQKGQPKLEKCRYSIYKIDVCDSIVECYCRISNNYGEFKPDLNLYPGNKNNGKYILKWQAEIQNNIDEQASAKAINNDIDLELDPVPVTAGWSGRGDEISKLLNPKFSVAILSGVGGQGKSALASEFLRRYARGDGKRFEVGIWVDCRELPGTIHLKLMELLEILSNGEEKVIKYRDEKIEDTIIRLYGYLKTRRYLIVFDNVDAYVDIKEQQIVGQLTNVLNMALDQEHRSLIIMTCRIPITDNRANYLPINLNGLSNEEGIEFFRNRGIKVESEIDIKCCKKIIGLTKGHPWWLGLIAGQIQVNKISFERCVKQFDEYSLGDNSKVKEYFAAIWESLTSKIDKLCQRVIRHLVETPKPLNDSQIQLILSKEANYKDINKALIRVKNLKLLECHEDMGSNGKLYQVHPLVRDFIHSCYPVEEQKTIVSQVLCLFLNPKIVDLLFNRRNEFEQYDIDVSYNKDFVDSIDTCICSRNYIEALELICNSHQSLKDMGFHLDLQSLGCRILNEIDWDSEQITIIKRKADFLANVIDVLSLSGNSEEVHNYLGKYKVFTIDNSIPYSLYLSLSALMLWREGEYGKALECCNEYEEIKRNHDSVWSFQDMLTTKALILRDKGRHIEAKNIFNSQDDSASKFGNIGRCYQMMGDSKNAIKYYRQSLNMLKGEKDLVSNTNKGYALFWVCQLMNDSGKKREAKLFLYLCEYVWNNYAPGLLSNITEIKESLKYVSIEGDIIENAKKMLNEFLQSKDGEKVVF